eukprot:118256-Pelagomonas_calceolata.AAC.3
MYWFVLNGHHALDVMSCSAGSGNSLVDGHVLVRTEWSPRRGYLPCRAGSGDVPVQSCCTA